MKTDLGIAGVLEVGISGNYFMATDANEATRTARVDANAVTGLR